MYSARIIADSLSIATGKRITTLCVTFPRFILAEFNTHRMLSRNAASSRAIPIGVRIKAVEEDPFIPQEWGSNKPGMQAGVAIRHGGAAEIAWLKARDAAVEQAWVLGHLDVHKQLVNRLLEPFSWVTVVVTATEWDNFYHLRRHKDAQPEFKITADLMHEAMEATGPRPLAVGEWHLPYCMRQDDANGYADDILAMLSAARCARISYYQRNGEYNGSKDLQLAEKLRDAGHMSPFEHPAVCQAEARRSGNFIGWTQFRKFMRNEHDPLGEHE